MAFVFAPDGTPGEIPDEQLQDAVRQGYVLRKPSTQEATNAQAAASPILAAGEGVVRGATMGLADPLLKRVYSSLEGKTPEVAAEVLKARKEQNPLAAGAGELAGAVGTSIATGGGASALVGGGIKGAAFEGGLYGMGSVISESALENSDLTAERLGAGLAGGALAAGGVHGVLTGVGKGASAVMSKFGGKGLKDTLENTAYELEKGMLTKHNKRWADLNREYLPDIIKYGREQGLLGKWDTALDEKTAQKVFEHAKAKGDEIGQAMGMLEEYVPLSAKSKGGSASESKMIRNEFADYLENRLTSEFGKSPAHNDAMQTAQKYIDSVRSEDRTWKELWDVQSSLFKEKVPDTASGEVREQLRKAMRDFTFDEVASGKRSYGQILAGVEPEAAKAGKSIGARPWLRTGTVNLDEAAQGPGGLVMTTKEAVPVSGGPNLPSIYEPEGNVFYLPGQQASRPLNVRLGEPVPSAMLTDTVERKTLLGGAGVEGPQLPQRVSLPSEPMNAAEIEAMSKNWQGPTPQSVVLGEGSTGTGGFVFDGGLKEKQTPAWFGTHLRELGKEARMALALEKAFKNRLGTLESGTLTDRFGDATVGAALGFATGSPMAAIATSLANEQMRRRGGFLAANALRALSESKVSGGISKALSGRLGQILDVAPEVLGAYRFPLAQAAALGADALVAEHVRLASGPQGQDYLSRTGMVAETPQEVEAAGRKLALLDAVQRAADERDAAENAAIDGLFGSAPGRKGSVGAPVSAKDFAAIQAQLRADTQQPERVFEQVPADLRAAAPSTTAQAAATALRAKQFLLSKAPQDPNEGMPVAVKPPWSPSAADLDKFSAYKEAVEAPERVLKNMANGYVSPEQVEALQAVYPGIYADLQQKIGERLASWSKPLSFSQKLAFSTLLGAKALGMSQQQAQVIQQSQALALGKESGQGAKQSGGPDGRQAVNEAQIETESQKLEARRGRV